jgi:hypothetical protein
MKNRKILYLLLGILLIAFFGTSYSLAYYINKNDLRLEASNTLPYLKLTAKNISDVEKNNLRQTSVTTNLLKVAEDTKFVFKIKYKDREIRNMVLEKQFNGSTILNRKTESELNEFFKNQGYTVSNMSNSEIVFVNNSDRYSYKANIYFLGVYDDMVTIYKTDKNGDVIAHKLFNSNTYEEDEKELKYDFEAQEKGDLQYIKIDELKDKDGLVDYLIRGRKNNDAINEIEEEEKWEFKDPKKAFDYAKGLFKS